MNESIPTVKAENISFFYGATRALENLSLTIMPGILTGLIGPDGVGKSTFLSLCAGAVKIRSGNLEILGGDIRSASHRQACCPQIAYMPQGSAKIFISP